MKEASDNIRLFLQTAEMGDGLHLHALFGQVLDFSHDSGFEIAPNPFVRIEFGRVARQQVKGDLPVERFHEGFHFLGLVRGVSVDDQKDLALGAMNQSKRPKFIPLALVIRDGSQATSFALARRTAAMRAGVSSAACSGVAL